jgi:hypothetical protein
MQPLSISNVLKTTGPLRICTDFHVWIGNLVRIILTSMSTTYEDISKKTSTGDQPR